MDDGFEEFGGAVDPGKHTIAFRHAIELGTFREQPVEKSLTFSQPATGELIVTGRFEGHEVSARLHRMNLESFALVSRGFHWMQETPGNR